MNKYSLFFFNSVISCNTPHIHNPVLSYPAPGVLVLPPGVALVSRTCTPPLSVAPVVARTGAPPPPVGAVIARTGPPAPLARVAAARTDAPPPPPPAHLNGLSPETGRTMSGEGAPPTAAPCRG